MVSGRPSRRPLPSWAYARRPMSPEMREALNSEVVIPLRDSKSLVRGPVEIDIQYSMQPDPGFERDERVTAAIRKFDPQMVPLWGRYTFIIDNLAGDKQMVTFGRHVIARYIASPKTPLAPFGVIVSSGYTGPIPNYIELIWDDRVFGHHDPRGRELPGEYLPWNWRLHKFAQDAWNFKQNHTVQQLKDELVLKPQKVLAEAAKRRRAAQVEEMNAIRKDAQKILDRVSEVELKEHMLYGHLKKKPKKIYSKMPSVDQSLGKMLDTMPANAEIILSK